MISSKNHKRFLLNSSLILLSILFLDHIFMLTSFIIGYKLLPFVFPLSVFFPILIFFFGEKESNIKEKFLVLLLSLTTVVISLLVSSFCFDFSWDGQWYQQSAVYHLSDGWNPLKEPIRTFEINNDSSIIHFPKGSWYYAASVYSSFGNFEAGKSMNFILLFASLLLTYSTLRDFGFPKIKSTVVALLIALNPVVWSEITTYLVDGSLILYMGIYIITIVSWIEKPTVKKALIILMSVAGMINLKFTGLVFFCVLAIAPVVYIFIFKRSCLIKYAVLHAFAFLVSVFVFGYNPYITNSIERGHPFYPIMGTKAYPGIVEQTGRDDNEFWETPDNMKGKPLLTRMFYANFGRPDNAPYYKERDAEIILPFASRISDWDAYHFHETRVSGFGPYFSGILIFSFVLLIVVFIKSDRKIRLITCVALLALFGSLMFSRHFWWPRFGPQMWLVPLIPIVISFYSLSQARIKIFTWIITLIMLINGNIVLYFHMDWEIESSKDLRRQLNELQKKDIPIEVAWGMFAKSVEEKLDYWHISYEAVPYRDLAASDDHKQLPSVVEGYPNMVLYREKK